MKRLTYMLAWIRFFYCMWHAKADPVFGLSKWGGWHVILTLILELFLGLTIIFDEYKIKFFGLSGAFQIFVPSICLGLVLQVSLMFNFDEIKSRYNRFSEQQLKIIWIIFWVVNIVVFLSPFFIVEFFRPGSLVGSLK